MTRNKDTKEARFFFGISHAMAGQTQGLKRRVSFILFDKITCSKFLIFFFCSDVEKSCAGSIIEDPKFLVSEVCQVMT